MGVDFSPSFENVEPINEFRHWCQHVLPLTYDDSLSYYELLCKVIDYLNVMISNDSMVSEDVIKLHDAFVRLQDYVNTYFSLNVDSVIEKVSTEILHEMYADGRLYAFTNPFNLKDKVCLFFGDSLTWGDIGDAEHNQAQYPYPSIVARYSNCIARNYGKKSATAAVISGSTNNFENQIANADFAGANYAFIMFGINDFVKATAIGDVDSTVSGTFCGGINRGIDAIMSANGKVIPVLLSITPCQRFFNGAKNDYSADIRSYNEAIKGIAKRRNIKYINVFEHMGVNGDNYLRYSDDGTHFTQEGYYLLAECVLRNLGGNTVELLTGENKWNRGGYPSYGEWGRIGIVANGTYLQYNTYRSVIIKKGLYLLEFDYVCECSEYDARSHYLAVNFVTHTGTYLVSPKGITNGTGHIKTLFVCANDISDIVKFRHSTNGDVSVNYLYIENVKLIPIIGDFYMPNSVEMISPLLEKTIRVTRKDDGSITVSYAGKNIDAISAYTSILNSSILNKRDNSSEATYFPVMLSTTGSVHRGQIVGDTLSIGYDVEADKTITFSVTF